MSAMLLMFLEKVMNGFFPRSVCFIEIPSPDVEPDMAVVKAIIEFQARLLNEFGIRTCTQLTTSRDMRDTSRAVNGVFAKYKMSDEDIDFIYEQFSSLYRVPQDQRLIESEAV